MRGFDTAHLPCIFYANAFKMKGSKGPYTLVYDAYRAPLVPLHCKQQKNDTISRCKNAMEMWVIFYENRTKNKQKTWSL